MITVKGSRLDVRELQNADSILFVEVGAYFYVESGIVENELRVLKNWNVARRSDRIPNIISWNQGTEIPQELGDWLVARQEDQTKLRDLEAKVLIVNRGAFKIPDYESPLPGEPNEAPCYTAYEEGWIAGVFECGEILSKPSSSTTHQDDREDADEHAVWAALTHKLFPDGINMNGGELLKYYDGGVYDPGSRPPATNQDHNQSTDSGEETDN